MTLPADRAEAAQAARPLPGLERLIAPVEIPAFRQLYWERKPLVLHRDEPDYYAGLLTLDDIDSMLSLFNVDPTLRVVVDGKETPVTELGAKSLRNGRINALEELYARYRAGSTVVLNGLERRWEPLRRFTIQLCEDMSANVQLNIYLTPARAQGFKPHYDTHDVFIAQVYGSKRWRLAMDQNVLPMSSQGYDHSRPQPEAEQEFDLVAGDVAYLPRGTTHWATSNDTPSLHITVGVHPVLYAEVLSDACQQLTMEDVRFRRSLPFGFTADEALQREAASFITELVHTLPARLSGQEMTAQAVKRATSISMPTLRHHLTDLERLTDVWLGTRLWRRPEQRWHLQAGPGEVSLHFHNKVIGFPADVAAEVRYVAETGDGGFTAAEIPGDLDEPGRLVLVQTLLREGFVTLG